MCVCKYIYWPVQTKALNPKAHLLLWGLLVTSVGYSDARQPSSVPQASA